MLAEMLDAKHKDSDDWGMNKVPLAKCVQILSMLCEGWFYKPRLAGRISN